MQKLREMVASDIPTTQTWVNLDHAVAITDVPTEPIKVKLSVKSATIRSNQ